MIELQERLQETCKVDRYELNKARGKPKNETYYDVRSKDRKFKVGEKVLLLLPTDENELLTQWKEHAGMITITECSWMDDRNCFMKHVEEVC